ncbi:MAG TPA: hypothetical protein VMW83_08320 [Spirochaetia bacterium]|nr:hypothetical protein [Spirochaetia bacterium]
MGDLERTWTGVPEELNDFDQLKKEFAAVFQRDWEQVMVGAGEPFSFHRDWNAYLGISGLREHRQVLADLTRRLREEGYRIFNTIVG